MKELFRVVVAGIEVPVIRATSKEATDLLDDDGGELCGIFQPNEARIYVLSGQTKSHERDTINHEIAHALLAFSGAQELIKHALRRPQDISKLEETLVCVLTPHLHLIDWCK